MHRYTMKEDRYGGYVLWEDVEIELDLKDSEIAKRDARIEDLERDKEDLAEKIADLEHLVAYYEKSV